METKKAIFGRRAIREFKSKTIPANVIKQILEAGAMAPSAMDLQPCRFVVITNRDKIRELSEKVKDRMKVLDLASKHTKRMEEGDTIFYNPPCSY